MLEDSSSLEILQVQESQPEKPKFSRRDNIFILLSFVVGFAFCEFVLFGGFGIGIPLFFAVFYPFAAIFLSCNHNIFTKTSLLSFIPVFILLLCFALFDNGLLRALNVIALWLCTMLNLLSMAGLENRPMFWAGTWIDILKAAFYMPFHCLGCRISAFISSFKSSRRKNIGIILLTLLVISPVVIIVLTLLSNSDAGFESMLGSLSKLFTAQFGWFIWKIVVSLLISFPLFNLLYALQHHKRPQKHSLDNILPKLSVLISLVTSSALSIFSLIYAIYILLQLNYLFSAMGGVLPASFTYAEYARRGFFELVAVVFINFCLISLAIILTKRENGRLVKSCRISVLILVAFTFLLIIAACSKMIMYVNRYGLTPLRVYTSWFMILLCVLTLFVMIKMISPDFEFYKFAAVSAISLYLTLNLINVDGFIAHYNINMYQQTGKLDTEVFYSLSDSAIPEIAALKDDTHYGTEIKKIISDRKKSLKSTNWQNLSLSQIAAKHAVD